FYDNSPTYLTQALTASLARLRLNRIPLYYLHWPDGVTPIEEAVEAMDACRREGLIGAIGLSNVSAEQLQRACRVAPISAVQVQYSLVDRAAAEALLPIAKRHHVPLITWGSLAQGLLTGKYDEQSTFAADDRRSRYENFQGERFRQNLDMVAHLKPIAARHQHSPGQTAIRWLLEQQGVGSVLFGAKHPDQVTENLGAIDWSLGTTDEQTLTSQLTQRPRAA
ncbi:MAG: aldo/keto reductase, partial [Planctomycetaceae bacterium]|nr:aldo/keto reductase [Planctomycetaceae bacterium]